MSFRVIRSEKVFQGKVFDVRLDQVELPDGRSMRVDVVEHGGAVAMIPIDSEGNLWLVRQYRHAIGKTLLEIPAGTLDEGEDAEACAVRECREEIGMAPARLTALGGAYLAPGYSSEYIHFFLAQELSPSPLTPDADEDLRVVRLPLQEAYARLLKCELQDAKTIAGLSLALAHLGLLQWRPERRDL